MCIACLIIAKDCDTCIQVFGQSQNLKINIDRKLYWIVHFYLDFFCASSEWYSNNQNYEVKQGEQGRVENSTGFQALVCQFLPNLYTNFTKLSNTPLIRQCALICTHSFCILDQGRVFWSPIRTFKMWYLIMHNEFRSTQEVARQNIQVSFYIRSTGLWPNTLIHVSQSLAIIRNAIHILWPFNGILLNCPTPS
jgi:hypothetical protein